MKSFKDIAKTEAYMVPIGKYKGSTWHDVAVLDPNYLLWQVANTTNNVPLLAIRVALQATMFKKVDNPKSFSFPMEDIPF